MATVVMVMVGDDDARRIDDYPGTKGALNALGRGAEIRPAEETSEEGIGDERRLGLLDQP